MRKSIIFFTVIIFMAACQRQPVENQTKSDEPAEVFLWENATVYFLLTDRFLNGDTTNDVNYGRRHDGGVLRSFEGGDLRGVINKIEEGYFDELGVNVLWFSPVMEQIHGSVDEGTGNTYAYHGYWPRDWTSLDPNWGTMAELKELTEKAHQHGIRVMLDVIINHTGPVTLVDSQYPDEWVRTNPRCDYKTKETTIHCTLVENLPDVKTESDQSVDIPEFLKQKWKAEGRLDEELSSLDAFFQSTGYPRAPRFYIMKWLADYVKALGIDGFRVDTAKHTEAGIWAELYKIASAAFEEWKANNPDQVLDDKAFFMTGEVYNYTINHGLDFPYDDGQTVNFFENGFQSLINFSLKYEVTQDPRKVFQQYNDQLQGPLKGKTVLNYLTSHDDSGSFDRARKETYLSGTMLMLTPGQAQIYYGDEVGRRLIVDGAVGDANLRSMMDWSVLKNDSTQYLLDHWKKLGQFRKSHPAVGAGIHQQIQETPFVFSRTLSMGQISDSVVIAMEYDGSALSVISIFNDDEVLTDYYSGQQVKVKNGLVTLTEGYGDLVLLSR